MAIDSSRRILTAGAAITVFLVVGIYAAFRSIDLIEGPSITITSPANGSTIASSYPMVRIEGKAKHIAFITLNDRQIFVDEAGNLAQEILLQNGYNIVSIKATDRFNRKVEKRLELIYE